MAKDSAKPASGDELDDARGLLSGLLAEEEELDRRALWRLGTWAVASVSAVIVAILANQSSIGWRREQIASADLLRQSQQLQQVTKESQNEARRLAAAVETLNGDRDRLYSRVAVLEQGLDSVTGAIARQTAPPALAQPSAAPATQAAPAARPTAASPQATASTPTAITSVTPAPVDPALTGPKPSPPAPAPPAPAVSPVTTTAASTKDKPAAAAAVGAAPDPGPKPESAPVATASVSVSASAVSPTSAAPLVASESMMGPPDPATGKLIAPASPPNTVTAAPAPDVVASAPSAPEQTTPDTITTTSSLAVQRTEFGVDVGGANSVSGLRALWRGLLKSKANAALKTLRPIIVIKENNNGLGMQLRLVAGPINDAAAAAKICASLSNNDRGCSTTVFEGQRLAVDAPDEADKAETTKPELAKTDAAAPEPKPVSTSKFAYHRRYFPKHQPPKEDPPKPEPSTLSRLFGSH